jgi:type 1 glutamine amidotransferase
MRTIRWGLFGGLGLLALLVAPAPARAEDAKVVLVAGRPSHGPGQHEHNAGVMLLAKALKAGVPGVEPVIVKGGWPEDESVFEGARTIVLYMDGGGGHPAIQGKRLETLRKLMDRGVGLACVHFAVEVPKGDPGDRWQEWIGGFYETGWSTNPHWVADFKTLPEHPITRGVKPFHLRDEWYYNIRFRPDMTGVKPLLVATPDDETRQGKTSAPRGPYPHVVAASGRPEVVSWAVERPDGGRGFGFTGAHFHQNWGNDDFRTLVLNAIVWTAKLDVPKDGVPSSVSEDELKQNLDPKGGR